MWSDFGSPRVQVSLKKEITYCSHYSRWCCTFQDGLAAIPDGWKEQVDDYKVLEKLVDKVVESRGT